jgi:hypothetical protein
MRAQSPATTSASTSIAPLIPQIEDYVVKAMQKTGVPGVAVGIVYQDKMIYLKGRMAIRLSIATRKSRV